MRLSATSKNERNYRVMRRKGLIAVLTAVMVLASSAFCFAGSGDLVLEKSYPEDGQKNTSIENVGVKMYFNGTFTDEATREANAKAIKIVDSKGKKIKTKTLYSDDEDGMVLVVATSGKTSTVSASETYTLVIKPGFTDDNGNTLGEETKVSFKTYNQRVNNIVNMVMMVVMFGGIMVLSLKQTKDEANKKKEETANKEVFNPYREAKRTGKTLEEVMAEEAKRQEKLAKKKKKTEDDAPHEKIECAKVLNNVYKVKKPKALLETEENVKKSTAEAKAAKKAQAQKKPKAKKK